MIRELVQNSLDATRLQCLSDGKSLEDVGVISLHWSSKNRVLTVQDNGTGMSQAIIENHLLKVGSSRYQDPEFIKQHPTFFPISRFGIGVLSCFMIADKVEITTSHPDDHEARQLTLKSVHGRYLVRLLDKERDEDALAVCSHGTRIRLTLRASATLNDPVEIARRWIVIPGCAISMQIDESSPIPIGFKSVTQALKATLEQEGFSLMREGEAQKDGSVQVREYHNDQQGLSLAVAVQWSAIFSEWEFLSFSDAESSERPMLGLCVEGVRVQFASPGFNKVSIFAIANATGKTAPRTNVARSNLEESEEGNNTLVAIYGLYMQHIEEELAALQTERKFSITWSIQEATFLVRPFLDNSNLANSRFARRALGTVPLLLIEREEQRETASLDQLRAEAEFWTVDGRFYESAEGLLREVPTAASLRGLIRSLGSASLELPSGVILCQNPWRNEIQGFAFKGREPKRVKMDHSQRRLDIQWGKADGVPNWRQIAPESVFQDRMLIDYRRYHSRVDVFSARIARYEIGVEGTSGEIGVRANGDIWIFANTPISKCLNLLADRFATQVRPKEMQFFAELGLQLDNALQNRIPDFQLTKGVSHLYEEYPNEGRDFMPLEELHTALKDTDFRIFDPAAWFRGKKEGEFFGG